MASSTTLSTTTRRESKRFAKFLVVGTIGFGVDAGVFNFLFRVLRFENPPLVYAAQAISFTLAVTSNFTWNRLWTYPESRSKSLARQFAQFFVLNAMGLAIRSFLFAVLSGPFTALAVTSLDSPFAGLTRFAIDALHVTVEQIGYNITLVFVVIVVLFWNFFSNRFITYSDVKFGH